MGLFLVWCHRLICMVVSLCKHGCKEVCDVNSGIDPYSLLARSYARWWPDFVTFAACKKSRFGLKRDKKAQCVSNRCKDLFERKKYFGARCTLRDHRSAWFPLLSVCRFVEFNTSIICYVLVHCFGLFLLQDMFRGGSRKFRKKEPSPPPSPSPQMKNHFWGHAVTVNVTFCPLKSKET